MQTARSSARTPAGAVARAKQRPPARRRNQAAAQAGAKQRPRTCRCGAPNSASNGHRRSNHDSAKQRQTSPNTATQRQTAHLQVQRAKQRRPGQVQRRQLARGPVSEGGDDAALLQRKAHADEHCGVRVFGGGDRALRGIRGLGPTGPRPNRGGGDTVTPRSCSARLVLISTAAAGWRARWSLYVAQAGLAAAGSQRPAFAGG